MARFASPFISFPHTKIIAKSLRNFSEDRNWSQACERVFIPALTSSKRFLNTHLRSIASIFSAAPVTSIIVYMYFSVSLSSAYNSSFGALEFMYPIKPLRSSASGSSSRRFRNSCHSNLLRSLYVKQSHETLKYENTQ